MKKIMLVANDYEKSTNIKEKLTDKFESEGYEISKDFSKDLSLIVIIGGDGTFLSTVHELKFPYIPFVGVNTGHLGFFQDFEQDQTDELVQYMKEGAFHTQNIIPLKMRVNLHGEGYKEYYSINEFTVKNSISKTMHLKLYIEDEFIEKFSGDGMIISSTSGSTAYNYSAGGAITDPRLDILQVTPIAPLNSKAYRSINSGIVLPSYTITRLVPEENVKDQVLLTSDGIALEEKNIKSIEISYSKSKLIKLRRLGDYRFWDTIKDKFL